MGNCLKGTGGQTDNATLLSNNSDPPLTGSLSQDTIGSQAMPYNEMIDSRYPGIGRNMRLPESSIGFGHSIGGIVIGNNVNNINNTTAVNEEEQVRIAKRLGLIQHLPTRKYNGNKKCECVICMIELTIGEAIKILPCMHTYHETCIDDWLLRSLTCPSCMEPVDAALINSYHPTT